MVEDLNQKAAFILAVSTGIKVPLEWDWVLSPEEEYDLVADTVQTKLLLSFYQVR